MLKKSLLIVNDSPTQSSILEAILRQHQNYTVLPLVSQPTLALDAALRYLPSLILMDIMMPNLNGIEVTRKIKQQIPNQKILLVSSQSQSAISSCIIKGYQAGALDYCPMPKLHFKPGETVPDHALRKAGEVIYAVIDRLTA